MEFTKAVATILMKISLRIHEAAFAEFEDYINQELQLFFDIPMFRSINLNTRNTPDARFYSDDYEDAPEGELITIHDIDLVIPTEFFQKLKKNFGGYVDGNIPLLIEKLSDFIKERIDKDHDDIDNFDLNIDHFRKYIMRWAAKEKGFKIIKGDKQDDKNK